MYSGKTPYWKRPQTRAFVFQLAALAAAILIGIYLISNTLDNLQQRGIASGFEFLSSTAGFGISQTLVSYSEESSYARAFLVGLLNTLLVSILGVVIATLSGFIIGVARLSSNWLIARLAAVYIELFRNIPLLLQLFFWYFAVLQTLPAPRQSLSMGEMLFLNIRGLHLPKPVPEPGFNWLIAAVVTACVAGLLLLRRARNRRDTTGQGPSAWPAALAVLIVLPVAVMVVTGFPLHWERPVLGGFNFSGGWVLVPELIALLLALSMYTAAFIAEIVRAGILAVSQGQTEAAYALGLGRAQTLRLVVIPQAMRVIVPPLTNQYLNLTKNSSLAAAIAYPDLVSVFAGTVLNQTGQAIEVIAITMGVYLTISLTISLVMNWYNRRIAVPER